MWSVLGPLFRSVIYDKSGESIGLSCASYYHTRSKWFTISLRMSTWWRHQMEIFSALLAICAGNSPVPGEFPAQRPVTRSFDVYFDLRPNKGWVNNGEAGDLRRHRAHCDVIAMQYPVSIKRHHLTSTDISIIKVRLSCWPPDHSRTQRV